MNGIKKVVIIVLSALFGVLAYVSADQTEFRFDPVSVPYTATQTVGENIRIAAKVKNRWVISHPQYEFVSAEPTHYLVRGSGNDDVFGKLGISGYIITYKVRTIQSFAVDSGFKFNAEPLTLSKQ